MLSALCSPPDPGRAESVHTGGNVSFCCVHVCVHERESESHAAWIKRLVKYRQEEEEKMDSGQERRMKEKESSK